MHLIIAEKPSLGRAIAHILPTPHIVKPGYIQCGDHTTVTWCLGHLLEPCEPEGYQPQYARWNLADLPIIPEKWKLTPRNDTLKQLRIVGSLLKSASEVTHAGDPDREGQLLVDEVLNYFDVTLPVQRLLINDLTPKAIALSFEHLRLNSDFESLFYCAQSRQRADWLYGINMTRTTTLLSRERGLEGVFSVGRVQTPVLGLVVKRDTDIAAFDSKPYYTVEGVFTQAGSTSNDVAANNETDILRCQWKVSPTRQMHCDDQGRLLNRKIAERVVQKVKPNNTEPPTGHVLKLSDHQKKEAAPLPFSLSTLQIEASKRHHYNPQSVLDSCQILYEKHQLITYPRSDSRYLPSAHFEQRHDILNTIAGNAPQLIQSIQNANPDQQSRAWNDEKIEAHHAIIPTERHYEIGTLHEREQNVYRLICRNYIAQFYPHFIVDETMVEIMIADEIFEGKGSTIRQQGWKALFKPGLKGNEQTTPPVRLPQLKEGDPVDCASADVKRHDTTPPKHFTDATLLSAMTNISRFVEDADIRRTLRETDGLGTEATRAGIIETLFRRKYLIKNSQHILATDKGKQLISALPAICTKPDMTATWEATLETIRSGSTRPNDFINRLGNEVGHLIEQSTGRPLQKHSTLSSAPIKAPTCPKCESEMLEKSGKFGKFWACSQFPDCKATLPWKLNTTRKAKSVQDGHSPPIPCPNCHAPLVRRKGSHGHFWGCSNYPSCRQTYQDQNGKPHIFIPPKR